MDYTDMLEKMSPMNKSMLCTMLSVAEPPEAVCRQYYAMKKCLDKISAPISPVDLLRIAMDVGFNVHTRNFVETKKKYAISRPLSEKELEAINLDDAEVTVIGTHSTKREVDLNAETAIDENAAATGGSAEPETFEEKAKGATENAKKLIVIKAEKVVAAKAEKKAKIEKKDKHKAEGKAENKAIMEERAADATLLENETAVQVYLDGEPKEGVIQSGAVVEGVETYQVLIDGTVHEITEDDIE
jgi:hypothetical protein